MIPVCSMKPQYEKLKDSLQEAFLRVMESGVYVLGDEVRLFESACAEYIGMPYAVGVASGTDALTLALISLNLADSDEVIVPANSYPSIWGILRSNVRPVLCDVKATTLCMDEEELEKRITDRTKAIVVVHLYGTNMLTDGMVQIAKRHDLFIIEDCAQSFGAKKNGALLGTLGDVATFSFYPTKPLAGYGDGGMIMTRDKQRYERLTRLRMYGERKRYNSIEIGFNSRLDELQAALLHTKLPHVEDWIRERKSQAEYYTHLLAALEKVRIFSSPWIDESAFHLYPILTDARDALVKHLDRKGIGTGIHYPLALSDVPSLRRYFAQETPVARDISGKLLSLPLYNGLTLQEQEKVIEEITTFFS